MDGVYAYIYVLYMYVIAGIRDCLNLQFDENKKSDG